MTRKIHLRANKLTGTNRPVAACASLALNEKIKPNKRDTYRFMASEIVDFDTYRETPSAERCAHCDGSIPHFNAKRVALGLREWAL